MTLGVAHVNHGLRGTESERDEAFVRALAERLSLPCHVMRADVRAYSRAKGHIHPARGQGLRYRYFEEISDTTDITR